MIPHILIVDDAPEIREIFSLCLRKEGFTTTALSTNQALNQDGEIFSLAILDATSSAISAEENCFKLIERLKSKYPHIAILIFPPLFDDQAFISRALAAGVNGFLTKNGGLDKLFTEVNRWSGGT